MAAAALAALSAARFSAASLAFALAASTSASAAAIATSCSSDASASVWALASTICWSASAGAPSLARSPACSPTETVVDIAIPWDDSTRGRLLADSDGGGDGFVAELCSVACSDS